MNSPKFTSKARRLAISSSLTTTGASLLYGPILLIGLSARSSPLDPVGDPWLAALETLILVIAPAMAAVVWCIQASSDEASKPRGAIAFAFMVLAAAITVGVHLTLLSGPRAAAEAAFRWPSLLYSLEVVAWDVLFAISVLIAAPLVAGGRLARSIRILLVISGLLALGGLVGIPTGNMGLRNIGIFGYAAVFPVATAALALRFARTAVVAVPQNWLACGGKD